MPKFKSSPFASLLSFDDIPTELQADKFKKFMAAVRAVASDKYDLLYQAITDLKLDYAAYIYNTTRFWKALVMAVSEINSNDVNAEAMLRQEFPKTSAFMGFRSAVLANYGTNTSSANLMTESTFNTLFTQFRDFEVNEAQYIELKLALNRLYASNKLSISQVHHHYLTNKYPDTMQLFSGIYHIIPTSSSTQPQGNHDMAKAKVVLSSTTSNNANLLKIADKKKDISSFYGETIFALNMDTTSDVDIAIYNAVVASENSLAYVSTGINDKLRDIANYHTLLPVSEDCDKDDLEELIERILDTKTTYKSSKSRRNLLVRTKKGWRCVNDDYDLSKNHEDVVALEGSKVNDCKPGSLLFLRATGLIVSKSIVESFDAALKKPNKNVKKANTANNNNEVMSDDDEIIAEKELSDKTDSSIEKQSTIDNSAKSSTIKISQMLKEMSKTSTLGKRKWLDDDAEVSEETTEVFKETKQVQQELEGLIAKKQKFELFKKEQEQQERKELKQELVQMRDETKTELEKLKDELPEDFVAWLAVEEQDEDDNNNDNDGSGPSLMQMN